MEWDDELLALLSGADGLLSTASASPTLPDNFAALLAASFDDSGWKENGYALGSPLSPGAGSKRTARDGMGSAGGSALVAKRARRKQRTGKQVLDALRAELARLTLDLETRKRAAGIDPHAPVARVPVAKAAAPASTSSSHSFLWQKLAVQQRELRGDSEKKNRALRDAVAVHARRARQLRRLLLKQAQSEYDQLSSLLRALPAVVPTHLSNDEWVFHNLVVGMEDEYPRVDQSFRNANMSELSRPGRSWNAQRLGPGRWRVELRDVHIVPFEPKAVERAVWTHVADTANCDLKEARASYQFTFQHEAYASVLQQYKVVRRYREQHRTVLVSRELTLPSAGFSIRSTRLVVIRQEEEDTLTGPTTAVETLSVAIGSEAPSEAETRAAELVEDAVDLSPWEESFSQAQKAIENRLVSESVLL